MNPSDEIFDVVDAEDRVLRQATRKEVHAGSLLHRSVHILVFNPDGQLFLQKRALTKDENPGLWDTSAAGHVGAGDDYPETAIRELEEELGIIEPLEYRLKIKASPETLWEHVMVFTCSTSKEIKINREEISEGQYISIRDIRSWIKSDPDSLTSSFRLVFRVVLGD